MQFQHPRRKTRHEAENFLLNVWKWWKISFVFHKSFFFQNDFIDTMNVVFTGRANFSCSITENDLKKGPQKMQKLFKNFFFKKFPWRGRKQLESPADFFSTASQIFPLDTQKNTNL